MSEHEMNVARMLDVLDENPKTLAELDGLIDLTGSIKTEDGDTRLQRFNNWLRQMLGNASQEFQSMIARNGLVYDDDCVMHWTDEGLVLIDAECDRVTNDYELGADDDANTQSWDEYGLGGDDDVDYNASYVSAVVVLLQAIVKCESKQS